MKHVLFVDSGPHDIAIDVRQIPINEPFIQNIQNSLPLAARGSNPIYTAIQANIDFSVSQMMISVY